jgi:hypothetical protein
MYPCPALKEGGSNNTAFHSSRLSSLRLDRPWSASILTALDVDPSSTIDVRSPATTVGSFSVLEVGRFCVLEALAQLMGPVVAG